MVAFNNNPVKEITFSITLPCCVPKDVSYGNDLILHKIKQKSAETAYQNTRMRIKIFLHRL